MSQSAAPPSRCYNCYSAWSPSSCFSYEPSLVSTDHTSAAASPAQLSHIPVLLGCMPLSRNFLSPSHTSCGVPLISFPVCPLPLPSPATFLSHSPLFYAFSLRLVDFCVRLLAGDAFFRQLRNLCRNGPFRCSRKERRSLRGFICQIDWIPVLV